MACSRPDQSTMEEIIQLRQESSPLAYAAAIFGFHRKRVQAFLDLAHRAKK